MSRDQAFTWKILSFVCKRVSIRKYRWLRRKRKAVATESSQVFWISSGVLSSHQKVMRLCMGMGVFWKHERITGTNKIMIIAEKRKATRLLAWPRLWVGQQHPVSAHITLPARNSLFKPYHPCKIKLKYKSSKIFPNHPSPNKSSFSSSMSIYLTALCKSVLTHQQAYQFQQTHHSSVCLLVFNPCTATTTFLA